MSDVNLKLDPAAIQILVQEAVLAKLTPEHRDALLREAIAKLFAPSKAAYDHGRSPLDDIFYQAVQNTARDLVRVELQKPEMISQLQSLVSRALSKALAKEDAVVDKLAEVIAHAIRPESRF